MIYTVLGMHKSGTTLVSQILHHSGIPMDERIEANVSYDRGNQYERQSVLRVNLDLFEEHRYSYFFDKNIEQMDPEGTFRQRTKSIIQKANAEGTDWGFKDPRVAVTYPIWEYNLPEHKIIYIFRDPSEIWPRYKYIKPWYYFYNFKRCWNHIECWYIHNASILKTLEKTSSEYLVLDYKSLMTTDTEFARIKAFTKRELKDQRLPDLYRSKKQENMHLKFADKKLKKKYGFTSQEFMQHLLNYRKSHLT